MSPCSKLLSGAVLTALIPLTSSCGGTQASQPGQDGPLLVDGTPPAFDEERAFEDLRYLCEEIGPRRIGTKGAEKTRAWLMEQVGSLEGWTVKKDLFKATPPPGARRKGEVQGANVLARREGTEPGEIWICSHYDTFDYPGFVGANDAGSSTAVLVELARQLAGEGKRQGQSLVLVWFDGEERFPPPIWDDYTNSTFGSRDLAERMEEEKTLHRVSALILLDMVGDAQLGVLKESSSHPKLMAIMERAAAALKDYKLFVGTRDIKDDHIHFRSRRVPAINLIDFNYGPGNSYWHTKDDNMEHVSADSLGRIGRLVLTALPAVEAEFKEREAR